MNMKLTTLLVVMLAVCSFGRKQRTKAPKTVTGPKSSADKYLSSCCKNTKRIREGCYKYCDKGYSALNKKTLYQMYHDKKCTNNEVSQFLFCAGGDGDHTKCCNAAGIGTKTKAKGLCMELCNLSRGVSINTTIKHLPCLSLLKTYSKCYEDYVTKEIKAGRTPRS